MCSEITAPELIDDPTLPRIECAGRDFHAEANHGRYDSASPEYAGQPWQNVVDGGRLFGAMFDALSETRVSYAKTRHSVAITEWLLEHNSGVLKGLAEEVEAVLDQESRRVALSGPGGVQHEAKRSTTTA